MRKGLIFERWGHFQCSDCGLGYRVAPGVVNPGTKCDLCDQLPVEPLSRTALLRSMDVPMRLAMSDFSAPDPWPSGLEEWHGSPWSVTLRGPVGSGKSMLAAELLYRYGRGVWVRAAKLVSTVYDSQGGDKAAVRRRYEFAACLVLDDFGHGHTSGWATEMVAEIIAERWDANRPTIVTTNCLVNELAGTDTAAYDRLRDGLMVALMGASRRGEEVAR